MVIYCTAGGQSLLFGLGMLFSFIVIYDRSRLYAIYRQFQLKYPWLKNDVRSDPILKDLVGHRISEILAGVLIGLGAGVVAVHFCIA
jgi:acid phosphatase family membrane protein YuiD